MVEKIHAQISRDLSIYKAMTLNLSDNKNILQPTMFFPEISTGITMFSNDVSTSHIEEEKLNIGNICLFFEKDEDFDYILKITLDGIRQEGMFVTEKYARKLINASKLGTTHLISTLESRGVTSSKIAHILKTQESSLKNVF